MLDRSQVNPKHRTRHEGLWKNLTVLCLGHIFQSPKPTELLFPGEKSEAWLVKWCNCMVLLFQKCTWKQGLPENDLKTKLFCVQTNSQTGK